MSDAGFNLRWIDRILTASALGLVVVGCASDSDEGDSRHGATATGGSGGLAMPDAAAPPASGGTGGGTGGSVDGTGGSSGAGGAGGTGASGGSASNPSYPVGRCPEDLPGPALVNVPRPGGATYCIDSTEVTKAQYAEFVAAGYTTDLPDMGPGTPSCADNTTYEPTERLTFPTGEDLGCTWWLDATDDHPINCIDWCDAAGYCLWAGKRLCGPTPGETNEISAACRGGWSSGGGLEPPAWPTGHYPYGGIYDPLACNGGEGDPVEHTAPVASFPRCEGGYPGLFDLNGNVAEFTSICDTSTLGTSCFAYGGGFTDRMTQVIYPGMRCVGSRLVGAAADVGFRCCANSL